MTPIVQDLAQVSFHEATLVGISHRGDVVGLALDDVLIADARRPANVAIEGVRGILREGSSIEELHMEEEDGEILTLREEDGQVLLTIEWNDFANKRQYTVVYNLPGGKILLRAAPAGEG